MSLSKTSKNFKFKKKCYFDQFTHSYTGVISFEITDSLNNTYLKLDIVFHIIHKNL